ncbi:MAG: TolC family protein [Bacteroidota bacterium]
MYRYLLVINLFLLSGSIFGQEMLSQEEAVSIALENNYSIKISKTQIKIAESNNTKGNAGMLPTITATGAKNYNVNNTQLKFFDDKLPIIDRRGVQNNTGNVGVGLVWTVFDGMGMFIARDQLGKLRLMAENNAKVVITNTVAQVLTAYYDVVRGEKRVKNLKKGLEISSDRLKLSKDRYEVGQGSKVDFLSSQVDYNQDKSDLIAAEQALNNTKMALNTFLVRLPNIPFVTIDSIKIDKFLEIDKVQSAATSSNPNLLQAKLNNTMAELDIKAQKAAQLPVVDFVSGYTYSTNNNGAGAPQGTKQSQFLALNYGLRASFNIFDGHNLKRRIENAKLNAEINQIQEKDLIIQLNLMIERSFQNYRNSLELIKLENENYKIAYLNTEIAFERYRVGNSTAYELREVQRNAVAAETRLIEAEYNAKINEIELNRLSGKYIN